jgi:hypothetical protein
MAPASHFRNAEAPREVGVTVVAMARRPTWRLAALVLVGLLGLTALTAVLGDDEEIDPQPGDAPRLFLEAWARSREITYRSVADFQRTSNSTGAVLSHQQITAQRPPDRLFVHNNGANGLVDEQRILCTFRTQTELDCREAPAGRTMQEETDEQLEALSSYVEGERPLYSVAADSGTADGDCFELTLEHEIVAPPLGTVARYCFDPATGVPTTTHIERVEANDDIRTVQVSTEVTDEDLDPATALG